MYSYVKAGAPWRGKRFPGIAARLPLGCSGCGGKCGRRNLGDSSSLWTGITQNTLNPFVFLPQDWTYLTQPDPTILANPSFDVLSSAAYGTLTAAQQAALAKQALPGYTAAAAGNPQLLAQTVAQAQQEQSALTDMSGGTAPSGATLPSPGDILGLPWWAWLVVGVPVAYLLYRGLK